MKNFENIIEEMGLTPCFNCSKYSSAGKTFCIKSEEMNGLYWYYETDYFIIDIHDFFIKKERIADIYCDMSQFLSFKSSYIKSANGEFFDPYQTLTANTMFITNSEKTTFRFLLHANFPFLSVGVNIKKKMVADYLSSHLKANNVTAADVFFDTRDIVTKPLEKIANAILSCNMSSPAAEMYLEAKAKEWVSITLDAYFRKEIVKPLSPLDEASLAIVADYINDHYALDIPQELLEKIAMMSGTKLKKMFKQKFRMTITEYVQRKRMNIAETLLSTTELEISDIAKSVGYVSHSRFTTLFKKYKGVYPKEVKKLKLVQDSSHICQNRRMRCYQTN